MKKIINVNNITPIAGTDKYLTAILEYNKKTKTNLNWLLPDKTKLLNFYSFDTYFKNMEKLDGTDSFIQFVMENKNLPSVCISDHDCDGIMACVICTVGLSEFGLNITHISTDRFNTGYGMKKDMIDWVVNNGIKVIYTVDQGITCNDVIDYAHEKGIKVCVTDHHNGLVKCNADCIVNPCYYENKTFFKTISGATVILKLIYELYKSQGLYLNLINDLAFLAGITCLSDCMPLINENRILYHCTMEYGNQNSKYLGDSTYIERISNLLSFNMRPDLDYIDNIPIKHFNKTTVDFYFVPVVNALNRVVGYVDELINDLIDLFYQFVNTPVGAYSHVNKERKTMKLDMIENHIIDNYSVCVEAFPSDPLVNYSGICGLVASDVVENEKRPALIGIHPTKGNIIKFSGRSVPGYSLYELLLRVQQKYPELKLQFGGHAEALGASIPQENLDLFREKVSELYSQDSFEINEEYFLLDNADTWVKIFKKYGPFGNKFELPRFYANTTVQYCNKDKKQFTLKNCGRSEILCYSKVDLEYIMRLATKHRDLNIECILEIIYDETGDIRFKLVNILNRNEEIQQQILEERNNYIS